MKNVKEFNNYFVCSDGRIFSSKSKRFLDKKSDKDGYTRVVLYNGSTKKCFKVHRLVAEYFVSGETEERCLVNHKNGIKDDNRSENLEWVSYSENALHAHNKLKSYNLKKSLKVTDCTIINILNTFYENRNIEEIFNLYPDLSKNTIRLYLRNKCRSDLLGEDFRNEILSIYDSMTNKSTRNRTYSKIEFEQTIPTDLLMKDERYKTVEGFSSFAVTSKGRVYSFRRKIFRKPIDNKGYDVITLEESGIKKTLKIHRLVALHFIQNNNENRTIVNHKNLLKKDNRVENLEWVTSLENNLHYVNEYKKISSEAL